MKQMTEMKKWIKNPLTKMPPAAIKNGISPLPEV